MTLQWTINCALHALCRRTTPTEDHAEGAQGMRTSVLQYDIRTTGQKELKTYREDRHGEDNGDGELNGKEVGGRVMAMEMAMWMWMWMLTFWKAD